MPLTDTQIRNAKPTERQFKLSDGGWLFLVVMPSGSKLWRMAYRFHGIEKTLSFGGYPEVSLKDARTRRDEAKALVKQGIEPSQKRKLDKLSHAASMATTFGGIAEEYLEKQRRDGRSERTLEKGRWLLALARPALWDAPSPKSARRLSYAHTAFPDQANRPDLELTPKPSSLHVPPPAS